MSRTARGEAPMSDPPKDWLARVYESPTLDELEGLDLSDGLPGEAVAADG